ncbi:MAG: aromatic ring-hydroxylating dioxygenase subunit alpha, partial [Betaproteobacteria bacterium]
MLSAEQNELITRSGAATPAGRLLRMYWQPVALVDELEGARPVRPVRIFGQDLVLFKDAAGKVALMDRDCPHRGADLSYGRLEPEGLRCPFHGWLFDADGRCVETPGEPSHVRLCDKVRQKTYPVEARSGIYFAYLGEGAPPAFAELDCFVAPDSHTFAFKGLLDCNWVQALEVGIDPAHASFLHRFFEDEDPNVAPELAYGKQFRAASAGSKWPMTRVMREYPAPQIDFEDAAWGLRVYALRKIDQDTTHVRVTNLLFPQAFVIPLSAEMTITQWHVPVDDTSCYWYAIFTSFAGPVDKAQMRAQRLELYTLPDYIPRVGRHNRYGYDAREQAQQTYTGMGFDINVHDQWAVESQGRIQDRAREHLGTTDKVIIAYRKLLMRAIKESQAGIVPCMVLAAGDATKIRGPVTVDGIHEGADWQGYW